MKQILYVLGLAVLLSVISVSCKTDSLEALRQDEVVALNKYIKDNNLADKKDPSGIYFNLLQSSNDTTMIRTNYKVMMFYNVTFLDGSAISYANVFGFTTQDGEGHDFEEKPFFVDANDATVNLQYIQQIAGLHIGLKKMKVGEKALMVIPSELAFKAVDNSAFGIPRFATLLITVTVRNAYSPQQLEDANK